MQQFDLDARLAFMQLDQSAGQRLRSLQPLIERELPRALEAFYAQARATGVTARFFQNEAQMARAKGAQVGHWGRIAKAQFDATYADNVQTIGQTHARIGLEPRWYIGGYALIIEHLIGAITAEAVGAKSFWPGRSIDGAELGKALGALIKAVLLDMDLSISVYIEAAEAKRLEAEDHAKKKEQEIVSSIFGAALQALADKHLDYRLSGGVPPAYAELRDHFDIAAEQLQDAVMRVQAAAGVIAAGTAEITTAADDLSRRTEQQAATVEQTAAALDEITTSVGRVADASGRARDVAASAKAAAEGSAGVVQETIKAMTTIEHSAQKISSIISVIDEIAFQTNLLALNAGVEAARAGEAGRGFAVVASEVRALAQRSADAAKEIKALIQTSTAQVSVGASMVARTGSALNGIIAEVVELNGLVGQIAIGTAEQATALAEVNQAVNGIDQTTQQNAAMVEETTAAARSLALEGSALLDLSATFQVAGSREPVVVSPRRMPGHLRVVGNNR